MCFFCVQAIKSRAGRHYYGHCLSLLLIALLPWAHIQPHSVLHVYTSEFLLHRRLLLLLLLWLDIITVAPIALNLHDRCIFCYLKIRLSYVPKWSFWLSIYCVIVANKSNKWSSWCLNEQMIRYSTSSSAFSYQAYSQAIFASSQIHLS